MAEKAKKYGQFFTPYFVAKFMCDFIKERDKNSEILEPCAGEGIFLKCLTELGFNNITAYEIDSTLKNQSEQNIIYKNFIDANINKKFDFIIGNPPYVRWKNIPDEIKKKIQLNEILRNKINGLSDLLYAFFVYCIYLLKDEGELIFITPLFWTETEHSKNIRKYMMDHGSLELLINFHEMKIFKDVSTNICIFKYIKGKKAPMVKVVNVWSKKILKNSILEKIKSLIPRLNTEKEIHEDIFELFVMEEELNSLPWKFYPHSISPLLNKIEKACTKNTPYVEIEKLEYIEKQKRKVKLSELFFKYELEGLELGKEMFEEVKFSNNKYYFLKRNKQMLRNNKKALIKNREMENSGDDFEKYERYIRLGDYAEIGNGMVSGLDKAFKIKDPEKYNEMERSKFIKIVKSKDMDEYVIKSYTYYFFSQENIDEDEFSTIYPNIYKKLIQYRKALEKRYDYNNQDLCFWNWVFLRNKNLIENSDERIFVPCKERIDKRKYIRFAYLDKMFCNSQDVTIIVKKPEFRESLKYVLAILNSELIYIWIKYKGLNRGGVQEFSEKPLSIIPIRMINWNLSKEVEIHDKIVDLVEKIILTKNKSPYKEQIEVLVRNLYLEE